MQIRADLLMFNHIQYKIIINCNAYNLVISGVLSYCSGLTSRVEIRICLPKILLCGIYKHRTYHNPIQLQFIRTLLALQSCLCTLLSKLGLDIVVQETGMPKKWHDALPSPRTCQLLVLEAMIHVQFRMERLLNCILRFCEDSSNNLQVPLPQFPN